MPCGAAIDLRRHSNDHWNGNHPLESHFDPMESVSQLWETQIPFVDPQRHAQRQEGDSCVIMPGSTVEDLRRQSIEHWDGYLSFELHFDPMELWGTQFVDPQRQESDSYFIMPGGAAEDLRLKSIDHLDGSSTSQSQFDPMELWGTQIPFVDPFNYDERAFWTDAPAAPPASTNGASLSNLRRRLEDEDGHPRFQAVPARQVARLETHLPGRGKNREESWTGRGDESGGGQTVKRDAPERRFVRGETDCETRHCQVPPPPERSVQLAASAIDTCTEPRRLPGPEVVLRRDRVKLRPEQAIYIFQQRSIKTLRTAALLSDKFGITSKAIRDIWTQRSWSDETRGLETHLDV